MRLVTAGLVLSLAGCSAVGPGADGGAVAGADAGGAGVTVDGGAAYPPQLTRVEARVSGRTGRDLRLAVKGKDRNLDAVSVVVRLLDAAGNPVMALDGNHDGVAEAAEGVLLLEGQRWGTELLTASATLRGLFANPAGVRS